MWVKTCEIAASRVVSNFVVIRAVIALHNFPYEVSTERAFAVHYIFQGLLMKTVGDLTCKELEVFSIRERT